MKNGKSSIDPIMAQRQAKRTFAEVSACAQQELKERRIQWAVLLTMLLVPSMVLACNARTVVDIVCAATLLISALVLHYGLLLFKAYKSPRRAVHNWALEEKEKQEILSLRGNNTEELEKMLQWHLKQGNIAEADRISQRLLSMVDGANAPQSLEVNPAPQPAGSAAPSGLPAWMRDGAADKDEIIESKSSLPDWIK